MGIFSRKAKVSYEKRYLQVVCEGKIIAQFIDWNNSDVEFDRKCEEFKNIASNAGGELKITTCMPCR